jgi:hypothetical protein
VGYYFCKMNRQNNISILRLKTAAGDRSVPYVKARVNIYFNNQHLLLSLNTKEISFLIYLTENMRANDNSIIIDSRLKSAYILLVYNVSNCRIELSSSSVDNFLRKLKNLGYVILKGSAKSSYYFVNPKYFFKGTESDRIRLLEKTILNRMEKGESIEHLINQPVDSF